MACDGEELVTDGDRRASRHLNKSLRSDVSLQASTQLFIHSDTMGLIEDVIKGPGRVAFLENVRSHPQILVGDPFFDTVAADIFARIDAEDELLLNWDDDFRAVVGLYDQATAGIVT